MMDDEAKREQARRWGLCASCAHARPITSDRHVLVVPGVFFGVPNGFRLAWSLPDERLEEALSRLGEVLDRPA